MLTSSVHHFCLAVLIVFCLLSTPCSAEGDNAGASWDSYVATLFPEPDWLDSFSGSVRTWHCTWYVNKKSETIPDTISFAVSEYRFCKEGLETWTVSWEQPFRPNLSPDFYFVQSTDNELVSIFSSSGKTHALVEPRGEQSLGRKVNPVSVFLANPMHTLFVGDDYRKGYSLLSARTGNEGRLHVKAEKQLAAQNRSRRLSLTTEADGRSPAAVDIDEASTDLHSVRGEKQVEYSGRVLEWQEILVGQSNRKIPRLVVADEYVSLPNAQPAKTYRIQSLTMVDVFPGPADQAFVNWHNVLPGTWRVVDYTKQSVSVVNCEAKPPLFQAFLDNIAAQSKPFVDVLTADLRPKFPNHFQPASGVAGEEPDGSELAGTFVRGGSFTPFSFVESLPANLASATAPLVETQWYLQRLSNAGGGSETARPRPARKGYEPVDKAAQPASRRALGASGVVALLMLLCGPRLLFGGRANA